MLCSYCRGIFDGTRQFEDEIAGERFGFCTYPHHNTLDDLLESARNGCHICVWISNDFPRGADGQSSLLGKPVETLTFPFFYSIRRDNWGRKPMGVLDAFKVYVFPSDSFQFYVYRVGENSSFKIEQPDAQPENNRTDSASAWRVAESWIEDCVANHRTCNGSSLRSGFLPTRVLDLGNASNKTIRLCEFGTQPHGNSVPYMTLSHSWGRKKFQTLLSRNLEEFKDNIPVEYLTKTFLDAIAITRRCNVQYLWIDSLCIIQDSSEDWERESAMMADVYSNTYLNIAATSARDGDDGCFSERNPLNVSPYFSTIHSQPVKDLNYLPPGRYVCRNSHVWQKLVERTPLGARAWVLQERFLAPRTLHFSSQQLLWECCEKQACESHPEWPQQESTSDFKNHASLNVGPWLRDLSHVPLSEDDSFAAHKQKLQVYKLWKSIVQKYTSCSLTVDADKLVALSAVAQIFQKRLGDEYVAGMWRKDLLHQLLWVLDKPLARSEHYCAPTWSWASTRSTVRSSCNISSLDVANTLATVEDIKMELAGVNSFGALKSGVLLIRGFLVEASLIMSSDWEILEIALASSQGCVDFELDIPFSTSPRSEEKAYLLPIKGDFLGDIDKPKIEICGIVLQATKVAGEFVRIGRFDMGTTRFESQDLGSCARLLANNEHIPELQQFEDGMRRYVMPEGSVAEHEWEWRQFRISII